MKTPHEIWNEEMAIRYDPDAFITQTGWLIRFVESCRLERTRRALDCRSTDAVLDLGCGAGNLLERLTGADVAGVDLSDFLLEKAKERTRDLPHVRLLKCDAARLPFPDSSFDRIVCSEVLEHVDNPAEIVAEIYRVAKRGARVVITLPNEALINWTKRWILALGLKRFVAGRYAMSDNMLHAWHKKEIEEPDLLRLLEGRFRLQKCLRVPFAFLPYHRIFAFDVVK